MKQWNMISYQSHNEFDASAQIPRSNHQIIIVRVGQQHDKTWTNEQKDTLDQHVAVFSPRHVTSFNLHSRMGFTFPTNNVCTFTTIQNICYRLCCVVVKILFQYCEWQLFSCTCIFVDYGKILNVPLSLILVLLFGDIWFNSSVNSLTSHCTVKMILFMVYIYLLDPNLYQCCS